MRVDSLTLSGIDGSPLRVVSRLNRSVLGDLPTRPVTALRRNMHIVFFSVFTEVNARPLDEEIA